MEIIMDEPNACVTLKCRELEKEDDHFCRTTRCPWLYHRRRLLDREKELDRQHQAREVGSWSAT